MWCIPRVDETFIERMEEVLELYAKPYDFKEPVLCFDEKSKELHADARPIQSTTATRSRRRDYEYQRNGTANLFVTIEPKGGYRVCTVTARRTKQDFAREMQRIVDLPRYRNAKTIHIVLDNLNTHFASSFHETFGDQITKQLMKQIRFHYTPVHASWLNIAEIELSILGRQCLNQRIPTIARLRTAARRWQERRNRQRATIQWKFTTTDARNVFKYGSAKLT